ncbi:2-keto-4-pentenoate hydratase [Undibacterium sp. SXout7W]|uniref:2-keto-4-pentenoate hydratase n=1 Tax=Undibacterium sp. SXout7W TaxID=3413049 RepID=UPI003BF41E3E
MLSTSQAEQYAYQFLETRARSAFMMPLSIETESNGLDHMKGSSGVNGLTIDEAYLIMQHLDRIRKDEGEIAIGRKLGFTNRKLWPKYGAKEAIHAPIWSTLFDSTVRFLEHAVTYQSLEGAVQPRIEPEVVFKLGKTPDPDCNIEELADCLEWMAHAIEIVVSPYPEWKFEAADAVAAFGLHGTLLIGEPRMLSSASRQHLSEMLANASISLSCDESLLSAGYGSNVLDSPVYAIWHLHQLLKTQANFPPLQAGELITTGTWTDAYPVSAGQVWSTAFSGVQLPGLTVHFV